MAELGPTTDDGVVTDLPFRQGVDGVIWLVDDTAGHRRCCPGCDLLLTQSVGEVLGGGGEDLHLHQRHAKSGHHVRDEQSFVFDRFC